ncbi:MAG: twin-arginine translocase TatA/TatE family subunit [Pyrinomonadaceae bacterium]
MTLLFLESVGTTELLLILVVALIIFGPRKLPELSRSLGKGLSEFKRASDEFKRTWEREVNLESYERERQVTDAMLPPDAAPDASANTIAPPALTPQAANDDAQAVARGAEVPAGDAGASSDAVEPAPQSPHKADWV